MGQVIKEMPKNIDGLIGSLQTIDGRLIAIFKAMSKGIPVGTHHAEFLRETLQDQGAYNALISLAKSPEEVEQILAEYDIEKRQKYEAEGQAWNDLSHRLVEEDEAEHYRARIMIRKSLAKGKRVKVEGSDPMPFFKEAVHWMLEDGDWIGAYRLALKEDFEPGDSLPVPKTWAELRSNPAMTDIRNVGTNRLYAVGTFAYEVVGMFQCNAKLEVLRGDLERARVYQDLSRRLN